MKKHLQKMGVHKRKAWNKPHANPLPLLFAGFFGLIMVIYGISRLLAAGNPVIYSISPASQSASSGQTKTLVLSINPNGQTISGGNVRVGFDANRFTFKSFSFTNKTYQLVSQSSATDSYTFSFFADDDTQQAGSLGTLSLVVKPVSTTTQTTIAYTPANTNAYQGSVKKQILHTVQLSNATMALQAPVTQPGEKCALDQSLPKNDPRCVPCATNGSIIASNPACKPVSKPGTGQPTTPGDETPGTLPTTPIEDDPSDDGSPVVAIDAEAEPEEEVSTSTSKKPPIGAIVAVMGGVLLLAGGGLAFFMYRKPKTTIDLPAGDRDPNAGLFDSPATTAPMAPTAAAPADDSPFESVTVEEDPVTPPVDTPVAAPPTPEPAPALQVQPPQPSAVPIPDTPLPEPQPVPPAVEPQPSVAAEPVPVPTEATPEPAVAPEPAQPTAEPPDDEPADMFELAEEHPDSYGSAQLAEAEESTEMPETESPPSTGDKT